MSRYDATEDPLFYPGTEVLQNKAGLTKQDELGQFQQLMFQTRYYGDGLLVSTGQSLAN